jgi:hypothetical protein
MEEGSSVASGFKTTPVLMVIRSYQVVVARFDCFAGTSKERTARRSGVGGVNVVATRTYE